MCDEDWDSKMEQLAAACMDGSDFFPLKGTPLVPSIKVYLDDSPTDEGWEYDDSLNAIVFDENSYPSKGTSVSVYYQKSDGCG
jgi:hypothetical protein